MPKKMLIDASHPEETRVAVMQDGKIEDFDFEQLSRKPLRGNIYLARITRVEPSLQAAFVEYGGNRHGFLAFNEIHSDYYQIPVSDREVLRKAEALEAEIEAALGAYESDEDVEADLDEDDDGLRAAPDDVPEDTGGDDEDDEPVGERDEGDLPADDGSAEEEDEEEEQEPEDGGSDEDADGPKKPDEPEAGDPADYVGEAGAEEPGWHAIEEEEIAALPPREAREAASEPGGEREQAADEEADEHAEAEASGGAESEGDTDDSPVPAAAVAAAAREDRTTEDEAKTEAGDGEAEADDSSDAEAEAEAEEKTAKPRRRRRRGGRGRRKPSGEDDQARSEGDAPDEKPEKAAKADDQSSDDGDGDDDDGGDEDGSERDGGRRSRRGRGGRGKSKAKQDDPRAKEIAELERRFEDAKRERAKLLKNYRIQEVVKRRQIMLVQAVKEERGNKGAALTTYISLAGRYGVLMPNTARGGGVSRKITNSGDRKRLRSAMSELDIPQGMGLIIRTAGAKRTKAEIKRDYDYLSRLWETIRDDTLKSVAPCLIYEEASLIKRAIRDLYDKDIDLVTVQGEEGYREAKDFMKMLMPSHAKNVQPYREKVPLFLKNQVERQIDEMFQPTVKLPSGGYLVIQQTEALVSIDVNSGKSTKERNVEQTALKTNLEAAKEVARQCKLRDLAGLVVIDFIDMDERKNNRAVEKHLKDAMKHDRARIQLGYISDFGLLEFSRQRKRSGIVDGTTRLCPLCEGAGNVRSVEMAAMRILRNVEEEALKGKAGVIRVETAMDVALYTLNTKRDWLNRIEATYGASVEVLGDVHKNGDQYEMTASGEPKPVESLRQEQRAELAALDAQDAADDAAAAKADKAERAAEALGAEGDEADGEEAGGKPKRRRSRGGRGRSGGGRGGDAGEEAPNADAEKDDGAKTEASTEAPEGADAPAADDEDKPKKRRRRGRRGGRRNRKDEDGQDASQDASAQTEGQPDDAAKASEDHADAEADGKPKVEEEADDAPDLSEDGEAVTESYTETEPDDAQPAAPAEEPKAEAAEDERDAAEGKAADSASVAAPADAPQAEPKPDGPKRGGWWQRALGR